MVGRVAGKSPAITLPLGLKYRRPGLLLTTPTAPGSRHQGRRVGGLGRSFQDVPSFRGDVGPPSGIPDHKGPTPLSGSRVPSRNRAQAQFVGAMSSNEDRRRETQRLPHRPPKRTYSAGGSFAWQSGA